MFDGSETGAGGGKRAGWCGQCKRELVTFEDISGGRHRSCPVCGLHLVKVDGGVWAAREYGVHRRCRRMMVAPENELGTDTRRCAVCEVGVTDDYGGVD